MSVRKPRAANSQLSEPDAAAPEMVPPSTGRPRAVFGASFGILFALMGLWAFASPLMSVPDEPAHTVRAAAVVRGQIVGSASEALDGAQMVTVPAYINYTGSMACFAFKPGVSAGCQDEYAGDPDAIVESTTRADPNSPVYYAIVGLPTLFLSGDAALYGMRIVNAAVTAALLASTLTLLWRRPSSRWSVVGALVAVTPMLLFLGGSINPNAMEVAAAGTFFVAVTCAVREKTTNRELWMYVILAVVSAALLTGGRSLTLLWLLLAAVAGLLFARREVLRDILRRPAGWLAIGGVGAIALAALIWFTTPRPRAPTVGNTSSLAVLRDVVVMMFDRTFDFWAGLIGQFGWLDQPAPSLTYMLWHSAILGLLIVSVAFGRGPARVATWMFLAALLVVPIVVQAALYADNGWVWQGRYMLAVLLCLLIAAGMAIDDRPGAAFGTVGHRIVTVGAALLAFGQLYAFMFVLRRYVVGSGGWIAMFTGPQWQPPGGWIPLAIGFAVVLGVATWGIVRMSRAWVTPVSAPGAPSAN